MIVTTKTNGWLSQCGSVIERRVERAAVPVWSKPLNLCRSLLAALTVGAGSLAPVHAQEAVTASVDAEALFTSPDPALHANKQVVYQIIRELLEAGHWERADRYLTQRYVQHNPNAQSGRDAVVRYFTEVRKVSPRPIPAKLSTPIVAVMAEGDLVTVLYPRKVDGPQGPYTTTWYDTWRIRDGKADEHWDPALKAESPVLSAR